MKKEEEKVPISFTEYFKTIKCNNKTCGIQFILIGAIRTPDEELEENSDYSKWFIMRQSKCAYCPYCGAKQE